MTERTGDGFPDQRSGRGSTTVIMRGVPRRPQPVDGVARNAPRALAMLAGSPLVTELQPGDLATGFDAVERLSLGVPQPTALAAGDLNGDGRVDLVVTAELGGALLVALGGSDGFLTPRTVPVGLQPQDVILMDVDGDSVLDAVTVNEVDGDLSVLIGMGDGSFGPGPRIAVGARPFSVAGGDLDGDGDTDLAVANRDGNDLSILLGDGAGGFAETRIAAPGGPQDVVLADLDDDGDLDLVTAHAEADSVMVFAGNGDGSFAAAAVFRVGSRPQSVLVEDLDDDGRLDVVSANEGSNDLSVLMNVDRRLPVGERRLPPRGIYLERRRSLSVGTAPQAVVALDMDGDGRLELLSANEGSGDLRVVDPQL